MTKEQTEVKPYLSWRVAPAPSNAADPFMLVNRAFHPSGPTGPGFGEGTFEIILAKDYHPDRNDWWEVYQQKLHTFYVPRRQGVGSGRLRFCLELCDRIARELVDVNTKAEPEQKQGTVDEMQLAHVSRRDSFALYLMGCLVRDKSTAEITLRKKTMVSEVVSVVDALMRELAKGKQDG